MRFFSTIVHRVDAVGPEERHRPEVVAVAEGRGAVPLEALPRDLRHLDQVAEEGAEPFLRVNEEGIVDGLRDRLGNAYRNSSRRAL